MNVIRNREIVPDPWRPEFAGLDELATADIAPGDVIVILERWRADADTLLARGGRIGVRMRPGDELAQLTVGRVEDVRLVDFEFPGFAEGRAYSQARLLRSRHGFRGDIRASGDVSRDRLAFMERCGFNEFRLPEGRDLADALWAFEELDICYQPAADGSTSVAARRGYRGERRVSAAA